MRLPAPDEPGSGEAALAGLLGRRMPVTAASGRHLGELVVDDAWLVDGGTLIGVQGEVDAVGRGGERR